MEEDLRKRHDECQRSVGRATTTLLILVLFSLLTLAQPDRQLFEQNQQITIPFADVEVSFAVFLISAPVLVFAVWAYLQVYLYELRDSSFSQLPKRNYVLAALPGTVPRTFAWLLNIALLPTLLFLFAFKGLFLPKIGSLFLAAGAATVVAVSISMPRISPVTVRGASARILVLILASFATAHAILFGLEPNRVFDLSVLSELVRVNLVEAQLGVAARDETGATQTDDGAERSTGSGGADLRSLLLRNARMVFADLTGARLSNADLSGAALFGADLEGANILSAKGALELAKACVSEEQPANVVFYIGELPTCPR